MIAAQHLLCTLDHIGRSADLGLPIYDEDLLADMTKAVNAWVLVNEKAHVEQLVTEDWENRIEAANAVNQILGQRIQVLQDEVYAAQVALRGDPMAEDKAVKMEPSDWLQIEQAAKGCVSGSSDEWPFLRAAIEKGSGDPDIFRFRKCSAWLRGFCEAVLIQRRTGGTGN